MEKIAVTVKVPALGNTYEFMVPDCMTVKNILELMVRIISSEFGVSNKSNDIMLFDMSDKTALPPEFSFDQLGISDGAKLLMI